MNELALFAGAGGGILGGYLLGWRTVCAVEIENYPRKVLLARQRDGILPPFPIWDDIATFDGRPWKGRVDVVSGGFPCQDISAAGKGDGIRGKRSGLWSEMARVISEIQPRFVFVENSPMLTVRGLGVVLGDLSEMGYDARWGVFSAADAGARHQRSRIWIVADADPLWNLQSKGGIPNKRRRIGNSGSSHASSYPNQARPQDFSGGATHDFLDWGRMPGRDSGPESGKQKRLEIGPNVVRVVYGMANAVDRVGALGEGQVPAVVRLAWEILGPDNQSSHKHCIL